MRLTPEQIKERVQLLLNGAEQRLTDQKYDEALDLVRAIFKIDSANIYARAMEERILMAKADDRALKEAERIANEKVALFKNKLMSENKTEKVEEKKIDLPSPLNSYYKDFRTKVNSELEAISVETKSFDHETKIAIERNLKKVYEQFDDFHKRLAKVIEENSNLVSNMQTKNENNNLYRSIKYIMFKLMVDGRDQKALLKMIQFGLHISDEDAVNLEREATFSIYQDMLRNHYPALLEDEAVIEDISKVKDYLNISDEDHERLLEEIKTVSPESLRKANVLVIDNDTEFMKEISNQIKKFYPDFNVLTKTNIEDSIAELANFKPDLIISEMQFGKQRMSIYDFFTQMNGNEIDFRISQDKIILTTASEEKYFLETMKHYGFKNILVKPVNPNLLSDTINQILSFQNNF